MLRRLEPAEWSFQHMPTRKQQDQMTYIELRKVKPVASDNIQTATEEAPGLSFRASTHTRPTSNTTAG